MYTKIFYPQWAFSCLINMLVGNGTVVNFYEDGVKLLKEHAVYIEANKIKEVGPFSALKKEYGKDDFIDAKGMFIMPGNICTHTHFYGAFARGMALKGEAPKNFVEILQKLWWKLDLALTNEDSYYSALVCLLEAIKSGTTTVIDHHASPNSISGSLDYIAKAVKETGISASLCYEVTDRNGEKGTIEGIKENVRFAKLCKENKHKNISAMMGLHASLTLSDATLDLCANEMKNLGLGSHIHVAEDKADVEDSKRRCGKRVVTRLLKHGILNEKSIAAHCVHVSDEEIELLKEHRVSVVHNPESNMNNAVGVAPVSKMLSKGVMLGLGTDGMTLDMFKEMRCAYLLHKLYENDPRALSAPDLLRVAYVNNRKIAERITGRKTGLITNGAEADIILVNYKPYTPINESNFPWHFVFGIDGSMVDTTISNGKVLMQNREIKVLDEDSIVKKAIELSESAWTRV